MWLEALLAVMCSALAYQRIGLSFPAPSVVIHWMDDGLHQHTPGITVCFHCAFTVDIVYDTAMLRERKLYMQRDCVYVDQHVV